MATAEPEPEPVDYYFRVFPELYSEYENMEPKSEPYFCWRLKTIYEAVQKMDPYSAKKKHSKKESPKTDGKSRMLFALELHILEEVQMVGFLVTKNNKLVDKEPQDLKKVLSKVYGDSDLEYLHDYEDVDCEEMFSKLAVSDSTKSPAKSSKDIKTPEKTAVVVKPRVVE